jgi:hypothetical protein
VHRFRDIGQVVECLPNKYVFFNTNTSTTKKSTQGQQIYKEVFNVLYHKKFKSKLHQDTSYSSKESNHQENKQQMLERMFGGKNSYTQVMRM